MSKFNVMVPARNEEKYIKKCLTSIQNQTLQPDKIIVLDDSSTDNTPKILSEFNEPPFHIVRYERKKGDKSHYYARTIRLASEHLDENCDFIGILDADTYLERRYYEKIINFLEQTEKIGFTGGVIHGESVSPRFPGLQKYVYGANRVYTYRCWYDLNDGKVLSHKYGYAVDTHHYLEALIRGYHPQLLEDAVSWSLRRRPIKPDRMKFYGYSSWKLGYYPWYTILRAARNLSPEILVGYLIACLSRESRWNCKPYIRTLQLNRIKKLLGIKTVQPNQVAVVKTYVESIMKYRKTLGWRHNT